MIVVWRITTRCNLSCPFCAYDRRLPFDRSSADPETIRRFLEILANYQQATGDECARKQPAGRVCRSAVGWFVVNRVLGHDQLLMTSEAEEGVDRFLN